jgi:hypothetical protein
MPRLCVHTFLLYMWTMLSSFPIRGMVARALCFEGLTEYFLLINSQYHLYGRVHKVGGGEWGVETFTFYRYHGVSVHMLDFSAKIFQLLAADFRSKPNCKDHTRLSNLCNLYPTSYSKNVCSIFSLFQLVSLKDISRNFLRYLIKTFIVLFTTYIHTDMYTHTNARTFHRSISVSQRQKDVEQVTNKQNIQSFYNIKYYKYFMPV